MPPFVPSRLRSRHLARLSLALAAGVFGGGPVHAQIFASQPDGDDTSLVLSNFASELARNPIVGGSPSTGDDDTPPRVAYTQGGAIGWSRGGFDDAALRSTPDARRAGPASAESARLASARPEAAISTESASLKQLIALVAREHGVAADLIAAVAAAESRFDPRALSPKGARGIMQLMPATAERFGVRNVWSIEDNLRGGARYLRWLLDFFGGDVSLAVAGYNAGENAVLRAGRRIPPYDETRRYVPKVLAWRHHYAREFADVALATGSGIATPRSLR